MPLPVLTTLDDVRQLVRFLKNKPTGSTLKEAKAIVKRQILDPRKVNAYETWSVIAREGDRIRLSDIGWRLAREPENENAILKVALGSVHLYQLALEWAYNQELPTVTNVDVANYWHEHHAEELGTDKENTIKDNAVCFFHLAEGAGFGVVKVGRRGQLTRLEICVESLAEYLDQTIEPPATLSDSSVNHDDVSEDNGATEVAVSVEARVGEDSLQASRKEARIFVSHGSNRDILHQVKTILETLEIETMIAESEETAAIPVPQKVLSAMHDCSAAIIIVSVDESRKDSSGSYTLNENVLIEIGAAFVLYRERVVLLWDRRIPVPSNLQGLYRSEFEGDQLTWEVGMKLIEAVKDFK